MICCDFETTTHGKWILAGEHAVLRGHPALVFPIHEKKLTLIYQSTQSGLSIHCSGIQNSNLHELLWNVLRYGMKILNQPLERLHGHLNVHNSIPVGAGMGASAALCVALARWFASQDMLEHRDINSFAKELEHLFHGQSSGLDIAGVAAISGVYFQQGLCTSVKQAWTPQWCLSSCGQTGATLSCINTVRSLWNLNPEHAKTIDQQMHASVQDALEALTKENPEQLVKAINTAADCFQQWGLISNELQQHMQILRDAGALAVKPTGSGGGGYVLSLWNNIPANIDIEFIQL